MRKLKRWCLGIFAVVLGVAAYFTIEMVGVNSEFTSVSHANVKHDLFEESDRVYIGKDLEWTGSDLPLIKEINVMTNGGKELNPINSQIRVNMFIDETQQINTLFGELNTDEQKLVNQLKPVKDYQLQENDFKLVLEVQLLDPAYQYHLDSLVIHYEIDGKQYKQDLPLKNFIFR
ncbi:hypothetical protein [Aquisalibacillus elongatus]|uniref:hypothetical protein n=1 Tax=Aquisalibacillus elongatus TaxID=485577 RepID=UPI000F53D28A|nr:hypothetical protein [Aquisalibacillus elongatus]